MERRALSRTCGIAVRISVPLRRSDRCERESAGPSAPSACSRAPAGRSIRSGRRMKQGPIGSSRDSTTAAGPVCRVSRRPRRRSGWRDVTVVACGNLGVRHACEVNRTTAGAADAVGARGGGSVRPHQDAPGGPEAQTGPCTPRIDFALAGDRPHAFGRGHRPSGQRCGPRAKTGCRRSHSERNGRDRPSLPQEPTPTATDSGRRVQASPTGVARAILCTRGSRSSRPPA